MALSGSPRTFAVSEGDAININVNLTTKVGNIPTSGLVNWQVANALSSRFASMNGSAYINGNGTITIRTVNDGILEGTKPFSIVLTTVDQSDIVGGNLSDPSSTPTPPPPPPAPEVPRYLVKPAGTVKEGDSAQFVVYRVDSKGNPYTGKAGSVWVGTTDGTATAGQDYQSLTEYNLSFASNETQKIVSIKTTYTPYVTSNEDFYLNLYTSQKGQVITNAKAVIDHNIPHFQISNNSGLHVNEGDTASITITRNIVTNVASTVYLSTNGGNSPTLATGGSDYKEISNQKIDFAAGETSKTIQIATYRDNLPEQSEKFYTTVSDKAVPDTSAAILAFGSVIIDDQPQFKYTLPTTNVTSPKEAGLYYLQITRDPAQSTISLPSTVYVSTSDGTALANKDYVPLNKLAVTFNPGETSKYVAISGLPDDIVDPGKKFSINLYDTASTAIPIATASATMADSSSQWRSWMGNESFSVTSPSPVYEGGEATFTVSRSMLGGGDAVYARVFAATENKQGSTNKLDYWPVPIAIGGHDSDVITINFNKNSYTATLAVRTYSDAIKEGTEMFYVDFYDSSNMSTAKIIGVGVGYIQDA